MEFEDLLLVIPDLGYQDWIGGIDTHLENTVIASHMTLSGELEALFKTSLESIGWPKITSSRQFTDKFIDAFTLLLKYKEW